MAAAAWTPIGMLPALALNQPLADLVGRPRPHTMPPDVLVLGRPHR